MALSTSPTLSQIRAEIAGNSSLTTSSNQIQGLKGCLQAAIPGGFNRSYLQLASNTDIDGAGRNQKDFRAYQQDSPNMDFASSWTYSSNGTIADITTYFNCNFDVDVAVNPSSMASYVSVSAYVWPFFNPNCSYRAHPITGRTEAVRIFRVTFSSSINTNTYVSVVFTSDYTYQTFQVNEQPSTTAAYTVSSGPSGLGPSDPGGLGPSP